MICSRCGRDRVRIVNHHIIPKQATYMTLFGRLLNRKENIAFVCDSCNTRKMLRTDRNTLLKYVDIYHGFVDENEELRKKDFSEYCRLRKGWSKELFFNLLEELKEKQGVE